MPYYKTGEVVESYYKEFPTDLEERRKAIFSCMNTELKQTTLILMEDGFSRTGYDLQKELEELNPSWIPEGTAFAHICHLTLFPIGFLVEEKIITRGGRLVKSWRSSDAGLYYGRQIAYYSLKTAYGFGLSFHLILGQTSSSGRSRAPYNRVRILETLMEEGEMRITDLAEELNIYGPSIHYHLTQLKKCGFVDFESVSPEEARWAKYRWKGKDIEFKKIRRHSNKTVYEIATLLSKEELDRHEIQSELRERGIDLSLNTIDHILTGLKKQGKIEPVKFEGTKKHSEARLTKLGEKFIEVWVDPVTSYLQNEEVDIIDEFTHKLQDNPILRRNYIAWGLSLYEPHSGAKRKTFWEGYNRFLEAHKHFGRPIRPIEFAEYARMRKCTATRRLNKFHEKGLVTKERKGRAVFYEPKSAPCGI